MKETRVVVFRQLILASVIISEIVNIMAASWYMTEAKTVPPETGATE